MLTSPSGVTYDLDSPECTSNDIYRTVDCKFPGIAEVLPVHEFISRLERGDGLLNLVKTLKIWILFIVLVESHKTQNLNFIILLSCVADWQLDVQGNQ